MIENSLQISAMKFVDAIKSSDEYREYALQLGRLQKHPDLYKSVNAFREKNFMTQNTEDPEDLMDRMDELDSEYENLREIPLAADFFDADTSFCRMMQEVNSMVVEELDFQ